MQLFHIQKPTKKINTISMLSKREIQQLRLLLDRVMELLNFILTATGTPFRPKLLSMPSARQLRLSSKPESGGKDLQVLNSWEEISVSVILFYEERPVHFVSDFFSLINPLAPAIT